MDVLIKLSILSCLVLQVNKLYIYTYIDMEISKVPTKFDLVSYSLIQFWFQKYGLWVIMEGIILKKIFEKFILVNFLQQIFYNSKTTRSISDFVKLRKWVDTCFRKFSKNYSFDHGSLLNIDVKNGHNFWYIWNINKSNYNINYCKIFSYRYLYFQFIPKLY
jgi:hypothetical protein